MDVVVVGSCNTDLSSYVSHLPKEGETVIGYKFDTGFGGKGANQCVAAAKLGAKVAMIGKGIQILKYINLLEDCTINFDAAVWRLGSDIYGQEYLNNLKAYGVNCDYMGVVNGESTGVAAISVADNGSNSIIIVPGANNKLSVTDIEAAESIIKTAKVLVCQNEVPQETSLAALKLASKHGVKTVFNAAPALENFHSELFKISDVFCVNETEAEALVGKEVHSVETANWACNFLMKVKKCNSVIVTLGDKGAVFQDNKSAIPVHIPTTVANAVDTTGAGDSFIGSLAFFFATRPDLTVHEVIKRANHIASVSVTKVGSQKSFPMAAELLPHILA